MAWQFPLVVYKLGFWLGCRPHKLPQSSHSQSSLRPDYAHGLKRVWTPDCPPDSSHRKNICLCRDRYCGESRIDLPDAGSWIHLRWAPNYLVILKEYCFRLRFRIVPESLFSLLFSKEQVIFVFYIKVILPNRWLSTKKKRSRRLDLASSQNFRLFRLSDNDWSLSLRQFKLQRS